MEKFPHHGKRKRDLRTNGKEEPKFLRFQPYATVTKTLAVYKPYKRFIVIL